MHQLIDLLDINRSWCCGILRSSNWQILPKWCSQFSPQRSGRTKIGAPWKCRRMRVYTLFVHSSVVPRPYTYHSKYVVFAWFSYLVGPFYRKLGGYAMHGILTCSRMIDYVPGLSTFDLTKRGNLSQIAACLWRIGCLYAIPGKCTASPTELVFSYICILSIHSISGRDLYDVCINSSCLQGSEQPRSCVNTHL